jgi:hypothetical protein
MCCLTFFHRAVFSLRMPKKKLMGKRREADVADDDFDDMLAEVMAGDPVSTSSGSATSSCSSSGGTSANTSTTSSSTDPTATARAFTCEPTEEQQEAIIQCCKIGDVFKLQRWARRVRVAFSAEPLITAAQNGMLEAVRYLVKEAGADVNHADEDGCTALYAAAQEGKMAVMQCLVKELGADVNQAPRNGCTPLYIAAQKGHEAVVICLVKECGADIKRATHKGVTPLYIAAHRGHLAVVICLVKECGADVNQATHDGITPLIVASATKHTEVVVWLIKHGADAQAAFQDGNTAADVSRDFGAPAEQTEYLEARTHCANPGCDGAGLKKCAGCLKVFFCGPACIRAHWPAHKAECKRIAAAAAGKET